MYSTLSVGRNMKCTFKTQHIKHNSAETMCVDIRNLSYKSVTSCQICDNNAVSCFNKEKDYLANFFRQMKAIKVVKHKITPYLTFLDTKLKNVMDI